MLSTLRQNRFELDAAVIAERAADDAQALESLALSETSGAIRRFGRFELKLVRAAARTARPRALRNLAIWLSKLGNGWIYIPIAALLLWHGGWAAMRIIAPAALVAALLHAVYPMMKRVFGRRRPFQADPSLPSLLPTLDAHSFPSGHTMTLVGVLTPIVMFWPAAFFWATAVGIGVAWSRVATAHHYPSDVVAGAALGFGVGYPTATWLASVWL